MAAQVPNRLVAAYGLYYLDNHPTLIRATSLPALELSTDEWRHRLRQLRERGANAVAVDDPLGPTTALVEAVRDLDLVLVVRGSTPDPQVHAQVGAWAADAAADAAGSGPFDVALDTLRSQTSASDTRPVSCWRLSPAPAPDSAVLAIGAAVAHGAKGYVVDLPPDEQAGSLDAVARLQELLGTLEEELTASVEARDSIAWLYYPPGEPVALRGFHALLLTCGYNPTPVDLETIDEAALAEYRAAILPSGGSLDLDAYAKLVVFTLRGGSLITFPAPPTRQPDGTPFRTTFLWPHLAVAPPPPRRLRRLLSRLLPRHSSATGRCPSFTFPSAERPFVRYGTGYRQPDRSSGPVALHSQILLRHRGLPAAYRAQIRDGVSTVVGSDLGSTYATRRYFALAPTARLSLRRFTISLLEDSAPRQIAPDDPLEVEAIARLSPDGGCLLFVLNRLGPQSGTLHFPTPESLNLSTPLTAEILFTASGSAAAVSGDALHLFLAAHDLLILRLR